MDETLQAHVWNLIYIILDMDLKIVGKPKGIFQTKNYNSLGMSTDNVVTIAEDW